MALVQTTAFEAHCDCCKRECGCVTTASEKAARWMFRRQGWTFRNGMCRCKQCSNNAVSFPNPPQATRRTS